MKKFSEFRKSNSELLLERIKYYWPDRVDDSIFGQSMGMYLEYLLIIQEYTVHDIVENEFKRLCDCSESFEEIPYSQIVDCPLLEYKNADHYLTYYFDGLISPFVESK